MTTLNPLDNNGALTLNWISISRGPEAFALDFSNYQGSRRSALDELTERQIKKMNDSTIKLDFYPSSKLNLLAACVKDPEVMKVIKEHIPEGQGKVLSSMTSRSSGQAPSSVSRPGTFAEVAKAGAVVSTPTSTSTFSRILGQSSSVLRELDIVEDNQQVFLRSAYDKTMGELTGTIIVKQLKEAKEEEKLEANDVNNDAFTDGPTNEAPTRWSHRGSCHAKRGRL